MPSFLSKSFLCLPPKSLLFPHFPMSTVAAKSRLCGVVFDMDGTLTLPVIDFAALYKAVANWSRDKQREDYQIIADFEKQGLDRLQIMPGAAELCGFLDAKKIRRGLITHNVKESIYLFHQRFGMMFFPALSGEFRPYKPNPAPLLHICSTWDVQPNEIMMVGDSLTDDVACGKRAGALTCLLDEKGRYGSQDFSNLDLTPDFRVSSLNEFQSLLKSNFDLTPSSKSAVDNRRTTGLDNFSDSLLPCERKILIVEEHKRRSVGN